MDRKEAIEIIIKNYPHVSNSGSQFETALRVLVPELAESEDEKIRKAIEGTIRVYGKTQGEWICGYDMDTLVVHLREAFGALEKQKDEAQRQFNLGMQAGREEVMYEMEKEQKPLMCDGEIEDKKRDIVAAIRKHYPADYAEYLTSFLKGLSPEDNSEDEYGQEMLGIAYKLMYEHIPENLRTQEFWDSLKFMREYTGKVAIIHSYEHHAEWSYTDMKEARNNLISVCRDWECGKQTTLLPIVAIRARYFLEHLVESQKPAEWSEEDEKMLRNVYESLYAYQCDIRAGRMDKNARELLDDVEKEKQWLKSLRPQPHWKPSEEQMEALRKATYRMGNSCFGKSAANDENLHSLYITLEKL